ncbi:GNAT family N-acetyltransferase [Polaribacter sp. IC073]|uniref:GNAT family N-acetyltransferase n=1 Tax=Polaribacter sp. IC073 TaxID=2508540 RepID=UPI0011BE72BF|nr:GNAT family N-acetyltransferase [Polaribacter sp. IC073]TXD47212.1 GNAT family N-acetyltransferase [Polaribacter sp. IC073]
MATINKVVLKDLNDILKIEKHVFKTDSYPPFVIRQLFDISGNYFIAAKEDGEILGYAIGGIKTADNQGWILSLGVHENARGKGLGKQLTKKLIEILKEQHTTQISLTVYPTNASAIKIYKDLGFVGNEILDNYFLDHEKRIVMTLNTN